MVKRPSRGIARIGVAAIAMALALGGGLVAAAGPSSGPVRVDAIRRIQLPDARILSMSPDGRSIAALRPMVGYQHDGQLCVFQVATLAETSCATLTPLDAGVRLDSIAWSPDSRHLALTEESFSNLRDGDLWLMDAASGSLTNLDDDGYTGDLPLGGTGTQATITVDASPAFTPDGAEVTFSRSTFRDGRPAGNDLATVSIVGGSATHIVDVSPQAPGIAYFGIRWAPDGSRLYYSVDDVSASSPINGIWSVAGDGSDNRLLAGVTDEVVGEPAVAQVSSDGLRLLGWHPRAAGQFRGIYEFSLIDARTGGATPLSVGSDPHAAADGYVQTATFSPDATRLLELTRATDPDHQVLLRDLATAEVTPLVPDGLDTAGPSQSGTVPTWSTEGTLLIPGGAALDEATLLTLGGGLPQ